MGCIVLMITAAILVSTKAGVLSRVSAETENAELRFHHAGVVFEDSLSIKFYALKTTLEGYDSFCAKVVLGGKEYTIEGEENGDYYQFVFAGIAAKQMSDRLTVTLCAEKDGVSETGQPKEYSFREYAMNGLHNSTDDKFKTLLVDVLAYGANAQRYFGYNTDDLATSLLSEDQLAYATVETPELKSDFSYEGKTKVGLGATLVFESTLNMNILVDTRNYPGNTDDLTLKISYISANSGESVVINATGSELVKNGSFYTYKLDRFTVRDFGTVVTVTVCDSNGAAVSGTLNYSMSTYVYNKVSSSSPIVDLAIATVKYANSATDYFNSLGFTVTFCDYDGSILKTEKVESGKSATAPQDPTRDGYTFVGWDKEFDNISSDMKITAVYEMITDPMITLDKLTANPGDTVEVKLMLSNNPGILGMTLSLQYDSSALTLSAVERGSALRELTFTPPRALGSPCRLPWDGESVMPGEETNGHILTLKFKVSDSVEKGEYKISLSYTNGAVIDNDLNNVNLLTFDGVVTVK